MNASAVDVAERIYDFAGLPLSTQQRCAIEEWSEENKAGSRGAHTYTAEQYGLTDDEIRDAFGHLPEAVRPILHVIQFYSSLN